MKNKRIIYIDMLKSIAIIFVILIHTTSNYMMQIYGSSSYLRFLILNSITSIAVPLFFMLSGTSLIRIENDINKKSAKRIFKRIFQLFFWTLIYLLFMKFYFNEDINILKSMIFAIFRFQISHLWFMYPLLALYILNPIISKLYYSLNTKQLNYLLTFTFIIPLIIKCFIQYFDFIFIPIFAVGFSEFGYFILGKYLYDRKNYILKKTNKWFWCCLAIVGILLILLYAKIDHHYFGITDKPYFDYSRFPVALYCVSFYTFFLLLEENLKNIPVKFKKIVNSLGSNSGGIYYIHMIYVYLFSNFYIYKIGFTANNGRLIFMILGMFLYLFLSWGTVQIFKRIPILKEIIN